MNEVAVYEAMPLSAPQIQAQVNLIQEVMKAVMKDGEHYGKIPGCGDKPSLLKPGAEKLMFTFRLVADPEVEVYDLYHPTVAGHREYRVKVRISSMGGTYMGGGIGSCSTMENKYRFRGGEKIPTDKPVPKEYWNLKNAGKMDEARQLIGGEGFGAMKHDGSWVICEIGEKQEHDNPADFYNCVTPDTRILTHDLRWVPAGEIKTGEALIGVEENMTSHYSRSFSVGKASIHGRKIDTIYSITLSDGKTTVKCNGEHKWLVKKIGLKGTEWVSTQDIYKDINNKKGRPRKWSIMTICSPWVEDTSKEAGYLAGLYDADGSLGTKNIEVLFAQQDNGVLKSMAKGLKKRGFVCGGYYPCKTNKQLEKCSSKKQVFSLRIKGGFAENIRLLGSIRPIRLLERWSGLVELNKRRLEGKGSGAGKPLLIKKVECIGEGEIVLLGSSSKTYIAEGMVAHNTCEKLAKKRALVDATLTVTAASDIFTQDIEDEDLVDNGVMTPKPESKPEPAKAPIQEPQRKAAPKEVEQVVNVKINSVTSKDGEKNGKPYTVYTILDENGEKYGTFDTKLFTLAGEAIDAGAIVAIKYVVGKFGNKITGMELSQEQAA